MLEEITLGSYDCGSTIASIFAIIAQFDKRIAGDDHKMLILQATMKNKGYLTDEERPLTEYMKSIAELPEEYLGTVYYEFSCLNGNDYARLFC